MIILLHDAVRQEPCQWFTATWAPHKSLESQFHMDPLQLSPFYEVFSSAELWKHLVTSKMSHYSARSALFYLFLFSYFYFLIAIRGFGVFTAAETPPPWDLQLPTPQCGTGQSQTLRRFHLKLLKQLPENPSITSFLWSHDWPGFGQGDSRNCNTPFSPVLFVARMDFQACPRAFCTPQRLWALKERAQILPDEPVDTCIVH